MLGARISTPLTGLRDTLASRFEKMMRENLHLIIRAHKNEVVKAAMGELSSTITDLAAAVIIDEYLSRCMSGYDSE